MKSLVSPRLQAVAFALTAVLGFAALPRAARADTIYSLNFGNTALQTASPPTPPPYGTVDVHLNAGGSTATVTFTALSGGGATYRFGAAQAMDVNTNGAATASNFTSNAISSDLSGGGAGNVSSFGNFSNTIDNFDGATHSFTSGMFLLTKASGTWASDAVVLANNEDGFKAAAHIFAVEADGTTVRVTGFAATPEFGSATLMGLMLIGFVGMVGVRRLRKPAMA